MKYPFSHLQSTENSTRKETEQYVVYRPASATIKCFNQICSSSQNMSFFSWNLMKSSHKSINIPSQNVTCDYESVSLLTLYRSWVTFHSYFCQALIRNRYSHWFTLNVTGVNQAALRTECLFLEKIHSTLLLIGVFSSANLFIIRLANSMNRWWKFRGDTTLSCNQSWSMHWLNRKRHLHTTWTGQRTES